MDIFFHILPFHRNLTKCMVPNMQLQLYIKKEIIILGFTWKAIRFLK